MTSDVALVFTSAPDAPTVPAVAENVTVVPLTVPAERVMFAVVVSETFPLAAETFPASAMLPVLVSVIFPDVEAAKLVMLSAPVFARSMPPVTVEPVRMLTAVSMVPAAPMPVAAVSERLLAVRSAPASAPDSEIAPAEVIVIVSPAAVTLSTSTLPLVVVLNVMFPEPPAVAVVTVRLPPVAPMEIEPLGVVAVVTASAPVFAMVMSPEPFATVALSVLTCVCSNIAVVELCP